MTVEEARQFLGVHLAEIAAVMPRDYRLTLVARHTAMHDADIVMTDDDLEPAIEAACALAAKERAAASTDYPPRHCDDYIYDWDAPAALRWFLLINRLPAVDKMLCRQNGVQPKLFAMFQGKRVRVVMASRFGDVGITENLRAENGYSQRVAVEDLSDFTAEAS